MLFMYSYAYNTFLKQVGFYKHDTSVDNATDACQPAACCIRWQIYKILGPVVRKVDSGIHRLGIFSNVVKMLEKLEKL